MYQVYFLFISTGCSNYICLIRNNPINSKNYKIMKALIISFLILFPGISFATTTYNRLPTGDSPQLPIHIIFTNDEGIDPCTGENNDYVWELSSTENEYFSSQSCTPIQTECNFYFPDIPVNTIINHSSPLCAGQYEGEEFESVPFTITTSDLSVTDVTENLAPTIWDNLKAVVSSNISTVGVLFALFLGIMILILFFPKAFP